MSIIRRLCCTHKTTAPVVGTIVCKAYLRNLKEINIFAKLSTSATNTFVSNSSKAQAQNIESQSEWNVIYRLPIIRWASAFNRLKVYQGAAAVAGIPAAFMLEQASLFPAGSGVTFATVGLTGLLTLVLSSLFSQNLIGFIYVDSSVKRLKIAYVDYWGRRKDIVMGIRELIPDGAQVKPTRANFYQIISTKTNENLKLKLLQRYGIIDNHDLFFSLFY